MKNAIEDIPKIVLISIAVIFGSLILYGVLVPTLGSARDSAIENNGSLNQRISNARALTTQSSSDQKYVLDNQTRFEELIQSDRLIPHTRRIAITELQRLAQARGLTALNYSFQAEGDASPQTVGSQPASDAYRVSLERLELEVGAPFDGPIYSFIDDISTSFPGSAVVQSVSLERAPQVTDAMLRNVSEGRDASLVEGTILVSWRTAQAAAEETTGDPGQ